jgi:hypothetical protein
MKATLALRGTAIPLLIVFLGCDPKPDSRIAEMAREQAAHQAQQQREFAAMQKELAEGSRRLVEAEAKARQETVAVQMKLRSDQAEIGRQRDALETERREIARQRHFDPIIAAAIEHVGTILVCLIPLGLGFYLLVTLNRNSKSDAVLTEYLVQEVANDLPMLGQSLHQALPSAPRPALGSSSDPEV